MYIFHTTDHFLDRERNYMGRTVMTVARDGDPATYADSTTSRSFGLEAGSSTSHAPSFRMASRDFHLRGRAYSFGAVRDPAKAMCIWAAWRSTMSSVGRAGAFSRALGVRRACLMESQRVIGYGIVSPSTGRGAFGVVDRTACTLAHALQRRYATRNNARVALSPWGPWSEPIVIFDPGWPGVGYGHFMHVKDGPDLCRTPAGSPNGEVSMARTSSIASRDPRTPTLPMRRSTSCYRPLIPITRSS